MRDAKLVYVLVFLFSLYSVFAVTPTIISPSSGWFSNYSVVLNVSTDDNANVTFNTSSFTSTTTLFLNSSNGNFTLNSTFLSEGNNTIFIQVINASDSTDNTTSSVANVAVDTIAPAFNGSLQNQSLELGFSFSLDVNASDANIIHYFVNDTGNFIINANDGVITNVSVMSLRVYSLNVSVDDSAGNTNFSLFNISVSDSFAPVWLQPLADQSVEFGSLFSYDVNASDADTITYFINDTSNFAVDSNTGVITNHTGLSLRVYALNITANDSSNNPSAGVILVNVSDSTAPVWLQAPVNQVVEYDTVFSYDLNASDLVAIDTYFVNDTGNFVINSSGFLTNNTNLSIRSYALNISVNDTSGNENSSVITVTVQETSKPYFSPVPSDQIIEAGSVFGYDIDASDNVALDTFAVNDTGNFAINSSGWLSNASVLSPRNYTVNITINDTSDNQNSTLITITVQDTKDPWFSPDPSDQTVEYGDQFTYDIDATDLFAFDAFAVNDTSNFAINSSGHLTNASALGLRNYTVNITINDTSNNLNSTLITVTVQDTTKPRFDPDPSDQLVEYGVQFNYDINATDLVGIGSYSVNDTGNFAINSSGWLRNVSALSFGGVYDLNITVNDTSGNENSSVITVTVQETSKPYFSPVPSDQIIEAGSVFGYDIDASDNVALDTFAVNDTGNFAINSSGWLSNASVLDVRNYTVNITINDTSNNLNSTLLTVTVQDTTKPKFDPNPTDQIAYHGFLFSYDVNASDLVAVDKYSINDTNNFAIGSATGTITNATNLSVRSYAVNISVNDTSGNQNSSVIIITVQDITKPWFDPVPSNQLVEYGVQFNYDLNASDNIAVDSFSVNDTGNFAINSSGWLRNVSALGIGSIYDLNITVNDTSGNQNSTVIRVTVQETVKPWFDPVPSTQTVEYNTAFSYDINGSDNVAVSGYSVNDTGNFVINSSGWLSNASVLDVRNYTINITVNDTSNNQNSTLLTIVVQDTVPPKFSPVPSNQVVEFGSLFSYDVNASDNIAGYAVNDTGNFAVNADGLITNNTNLSLGVYSLNISVNDTSGNSNYSIISVTVQDTTKPYFSPVPSNQVVEFGSLFSYDVNASDLVAVDKYSINDTNNFAIGSATGTITNATNLSVRSYAVNISVNDTSGNQNSSVITITVQETTKPWFDPDPSTQTVEYNTAFSYDINASDNVAIDSYSVNDTDNFAISSNGLLTNNSLLSVRNYTINITINDTSNNQNSTLINITVQDTVPPVFSPVPSDQVVEYGSLFTYDIDAVDNIAGYSVNDTANFAINSSGLLSNNSVLGFRSYAVNITVNDTSGNQNSTIISVTVQDTTKPWFSPNPSSQTVNYSLSFGYQLSGVDNLNVSGYSVNDTGNFAVNSSGYLRNNTRLSVRVYSLNITINDTSNNLNSSVISVTVRVANTSSVVANTSTNFDLSSASTNLTLFLKSNVSTTVTVTNKPANSSGITSSLHSLKAVEFDVDDSTSGNLTWALIKIYYSQAELTAADISESSLRIYYYNSTAADWQLEPVQGVDVVNDFVWANITHFSLFGAFGSAPTTTTTVTATTTTTTAPGGGMVSAKYELGDGLKTVILRTVDKLLFTVKGRVHTAQIKKLFDDHVTVTVRSPDPGFDVDLYPNKTAKVDIDEDGVFDLSMSLDKIYTFAAKITFLAVSEPVPVGEEPVSIVERVEEIVEQLAVEPEEVVAPPVEPRNWVLIIVVVIVIVAAVFYLVPKKYFRRLKRLF